MFKHILNLLETDIWFPVFQKLKARNDFARWVLSTVKGRESSKVQAVAPWKQNPRNTGGNTGET